MKPDLSASGTGKLAPQAVSPARPRSSLRSDRRREDQENAIEEEKRKSRLVDGAIFRGAGQRWAHLRIPGPAGLLTESVTGCSPLEIVKSFPHRGGLSSPGSLKVFDWSFARRYK